MSPTLMVRTGLALALAVFITLACSSGGDGGGNGTSNATSDASDGDATGPSDDEPTDEEIAAFNVALEEIFGEDISDSDRTKWLGNGEINCGFDSATIAQNWTGTGGGIALNETGLATLEASIRYLCPERLDILEHPGQYVEAE